MYGRRGCKLQISGMSFEPNVFLDRIQIPKERILFTGLLEIPDENREQLKNLKMPELPASLGIDDLTRLFDRQNLLISLSDAVYLTTQINEAIVFMQTYFNELKTLLTKGDIDDAILSFNAEPDEALENFRDFPPEFHGLFDESGIYAIEVGTKDQPTTTFSQ